VSSLLLLALGISVSAGAGVYSRLRWPLPAERLAERLIRFVLWVVLPPCVFVNVAHFDIASSAGLGLALGFGCLLVGGLVAWFLATRVLRLPDRTAGAVICASIVANTGYYGLPATLIVFGSDAVARAAAWDALLTGPVTFLAGFAVGAVYGEDSGDGFGERARYFVRRNPVLWVLVPALFFPGSAIPGWTLEVSHLAFVALLPVGFYVLGVNLAHGSGEPGKESLAAPVAVAVGVRLAVIPGLFLAACAAVGGIPSSYFIQAAAPAGINALIVATLFGLDRRVTATAIAVSTAIAMVGVVVIGSL
jgi:predicted permease